MALVSSPWKENPFLPSIKIHSIFHSLLDNCSFHEISSTVSQIESLVALGAAYLSSHGCGFAQ